MYSNGALPLDARCGYALTVTVTQSLGVNRPLAYGNRSLKCIIAQSQIKLFKKYDLR